MGAKRNLEIHKQVIKKHQGLLEYTLCLILCSDTTLVASI